MIRKYAEYLPALLAGYRQFVPSDSQFGNQWHLNNASGPDINVTGIWDDYTGAGVDLAVIDDGFDFTHGDLSPNYDVARDHDFENNDNDASPFYADDSHGTT
ncbi:MAG TPA: hypothetical protein ENJ99_03015, partial [Rhizobiales bacterium]|nr:hypothetical protein [Hyphomicrobiales bacterium]